MRNLLNLLVRATTKIQGFFLSSKLTNPELERLRERAPEWEQIFAAETGILKGLDLVPLLMARTPGMLSFCRKYGTLSRQEPLQTAFVLASFSQRQVPQIREEQLRVRVGLWSDNPSPCPSGLKTGHGSQPFSQHLCLTGNAPFLTGTPGTGRAALPFALQRTSCRTSLWEVWGGSSHSNHPHPLAGLIRQGVAPRMEQS